PNPASDAVEMDADASDVAAVAARLSAAGVTTTDRIAVVHVSAGNPFRRWPLEHFVETLRSLASRADHRIIVTSGPSEQDAVTRVVERARAALDRDAAARIVTCGDFSLSELRALLDRAAVYIGGDSGPLHVAATTRVPIVGLYGPTLPARSAPWRSPACATESVDAGDLPCRPCDQRVCEPGDFRCLTSIDAARVFEAAKRALKSR